MRCHVQVCLLLLCCPLLSVLSAGPLASVRRSRAGALHENGRRLKADASYKTTSLMSGVAAVSGNCLCSQDLYVILSYEVFADRAGSAQMEA